MNKEDYYKPIFAHIGELPELNNHIEEIEEEENEFNRLAAEFLMTKILQLYLIMDSPNFEKNKQHLAEEMEIYIKNHSK